MSWQAKYNVAVFALTVGILCGWIGYVLHQKGECDRSGGTYIPSADACVMPAPPPPPRDEDGPHIETSPGVEFRYSRAGELARVNVKLPDGGVDCYRPATTSAMTIALVPCEGGPR